MRILIADDHPLVRDALARTVKLVRPEAEISQAKDFGEVEALLPADLAILDLNMPGMDRIDGVRRLREAFADVIMVVVSGDDDPATIRSVLAAGAAGFLPKAEAPDVLVHAIQLVLSGGTYIPAKAMSDFVRGQPPARPDTSGLTPRQTDVLRLLMRGQPNKVIARELGLTEGTVKIHIAAILRALQASNRTEAVIAARALGMED